MAIEYKCDKKSLREGQIIPFTTNQMWINYHLGEVLGVQYETLVHVRRTHQHPSSLHPSVRIAGVTHMLCLNKRIPVRYMAERSLAEDYPSAYCPHVRLRLFTRQLAPFIPPSISLGLSKGGYQRHPKLSLQPNATAIRGGNSPFVLIVAWSDRMVRWFTWSFADII